MEISKKTRSEVRDETLWAMKEAIDNARGFVCHVSWLTDDGVIKHYNSQRDFLVEDLEGVKDNVYEFLGQNFATPTDTPPDK